MSAIKLVNSKSTVTASVPICLTVITSLSPSLWASSHYGNVDWMGSVAHGSYQMAGSVAHGSYQMAGNGQDTFVVDRSFRRDTVGSV